MPSASTATPKTAVNLFPQYMSSNILMWGGWRLRNIPVRVLTTAPVISEAAFWQASPSAGFAGVDRNRLLKNFACEGN